MGKNNFILIAIIVVLLLVIVSGIIVYMFFLSGPKQPVEVPIKINKNLIMYGFEEPFTNNVKDGGKKISRVVVKVEIEKSAEELMNYRNSEIRDKINLIMRSKVEQDLQGPEAQLKLQKEILESIRKILNTSKKVINVYFDEFIVQ